MSSSRWTRWAGCEGEVPAGSNQQMHPAGLISCALAAPNRELC
jgi:hypothetical protein